jgi:hypothetical protein
LCDSYWLDLIILDRQPAVNRVVPRSFPGQTLSAAAMGHPLVGQWPAPEHDLQRREMSSEAASHIFVVVCN